MASQYHAHSLPGRPESEWQPLEAHLLAVAQRARQCSEPFNAGDWSYLAGLWHDVGKYSAEFQEYIRENTEAGSETRLRQVDHSTAGAQLASRQREGLDGKIIAYVIAGHHAGLPDGIGGESSLDNRMKKKVPEYSLPNEIIGVQCDELQLPLKKSADDRERGMSASLFIRMLFSTVVDSDFLDTESFMDAARAAQRPQPQDVGVLQQRLHSALEDLQRHSPPTSVNNSRRLVLESCRSAAELSPGFFSLTVPTGGGKTLASLAFALKHACKYELRRVIYAVPFTSIIEQNAQVFRDILGEDSVLEHHSNIDPKRESVWGRLCAENWASSLVVTTNVQFFESFFASRTSANRKLHNVAQSVIILDEAQALPIKLLHPCLALLRELVTSYGCTVVLCTATQPALEFREEFPIGLSAPRQIIEDPKALFETLKRVKVVRRGKLTDAELVSDLCALDRVLCIVNTRRHAHELFEKLGRKDGNMHLSALMCPAHRSVTLNEIQARLKQGQRCRLISTQLVEAGVDLDFPVVYRAMAGLDSIAQAAGRCNREGSTPEGCMVLFESEVPVPAGQLRHAAQAAVEVIENYDDILSLDAIEAFFRLFYWQHSGDWDKLDVVRRLTDGYPTISFPFRSIAKDFKFIRDDMSPVIIPWDDGAIGVIASLRHAPVPPAGTERRLQRYTVNVPTTVLNELPVEILHDRFYVLVNMDHYDEHTGLRIGQASPAWAVESLMV